MIQAAELRGDFRRVQQVKLFIIGHYFVPIWESQAELPESCQARLLKHAVSIPIQSGFAGVELQTVIFKSLPKACEIIENQTKTAFLTHPVQVFRVFGRAEPPGPCIIDHPSSFRTPSQAGLNFPKKFSKNP